MISLHQLSKGLLSRCYCDSARICWVWLSLQYVHNRGTQYQGDWVSSTSSARICWASPNNYVQHTDLADDGCVWLTNTQLKNSAEADSCVWLFIHSSGTQQKKMAESGSPHIHGSETQWKKMAESGSLHIHGSETQQKKMAESGSPHRTLPGPQIQYRTGLSLASQWDKYRDGKTAHLLSY